jgi:transposase-like protein
MSDQVQRVYSTAFKESVVLRIEAGERLAAVAAELGIRRKLLYDWRDAYRELGVAGLNRKRGRKPGGERSGARPGGELAEAKARIAELERVIGRQQVDLDFFRKALRLMDAAPPSGAAPPSTRSSKR